MSQIPEQMPTGATHYLAPFFYKVDGEKAFYHDGDWCISAHTASSLEENKAYRIGAAGMSDRELLELAAKAAGLQGLTWREGSGCYYYDDPETGREEWNPGDDDGQAMRLQVDLHMIVVPSRRDRCVLVGIEVGGVGMNIRENFTADRRADTRLAILRAAAEIGRSMP